MVSIYDVAKKANVSKSTVSRVINNQAGVKGEKRQKVLEVMKELNYHPNSSARSLASKKNNTIGVVVRWMLGHTFYSKFIDGIYQTASKLGYGVLFCVNNINFKEGVPYSDILLGKVDGIIFLGHDSVSRKEVIKLNDQNFPLVLIDSNYNIPGIMEINVNNFNAAYNAVKYLIQLGHKRIAHFMGDKNAFDAIERFKGYKQALKDYELEYNEDLVIEGNYYFDNAYSMSNIFFKKKHDFTAIFCANDVMAAAFIKSASEHGFRIPEDISVIGFDDVDLTRSGNGSNISITTIKQPRYEMSKYAVESLVNRIENNIVCENKIYDLELIVKESAINKRQD